MVVEPHAFAAVVHGVESREAYDVPDTRVGEAWGRLQKPEVVTGGGLGEAGCELLADCCGGACVCVCVCTHVCVCVCVCTHTGHVLLHSPVV